MSSQSKYELPPKIETYLSLLSGIYARDGKTTMQSILVNSTLSVEEETHIDNWNGGTYGHTLHLSIPKIMYLDHFSEKDEIEKQINTDLNQICDVQDEYIQNVVLEVGHVEDSDWREKSGLLITQKKEVSADARKRIWEHDGLKLFLSHKVEFKAQAEELKESLSGYGISAFVAHTSITPTQEWLNEIENALFSMDVLVALITDNFSDSQWTDQEIGIAVGLGKLVIPVKLQKKDPYGFIGKYQALTCSFDNISYLTKSIYGLLLENKIVGPKQQEIALQKFYNSTYYSEHFIKNVLPYFPSLSDKQINDMMAAFEKNDRLHGCHLVRRSLPQALKQVTGKDFKLEGRKLLYDN